MQGFLCLNVVPAPAGGYASWVQAVNQRVVDLLLPFRGFNFYSPDQYGSASVKAVLPALAVFQLAERSRLRLIL